MTDEKKITSVIFFTEVPKGQGIYSGRVVSVDSFQRRFERVIPPEVYLRGSDGYVDSDSRIGRSPLLWN